MLTICRQSCGLDRANLQYSHSEIPTVRDTLLNDTSSTASLRRKFLSNYQFIEKKFRRMRFRRILHLVEFFPLLKIPCRRHVLFYSIFIYLVFPPAPFSMAPRHAPFSQRHALFFQRHVLFRPHAFCSPKLYCQLRDKSTCIHGISCFDNKLTP